MAISVSRVDIKTPEGSGAASRSQLYKVLAAAFYYPGPQSHEAIQGGGLWQKLTAAASRLPYTLPLEEMPSPRQGLGLPEFQSLFLSLFDVGGEQGPPCPLYEGHYIGGRNAVMAELLAFYHYFSLHLSWEGRRELPDHLAVELEFMHALTFKEALAIEAGKPSQPYRRAEHDFLKRHLAGLTSEIAQRLAPAPATFFSALASVAERFCSRDLAYLGEQVPVS